MATSQPVKIDAKPLIRKSDLQFFPFIETVPVDDIHQVKFLVRTVKYGSGVEEMSVLEKETIELFRVVEQYVFFGDSTRDEREFDGVLKQMREHVQRDVSHAQAWDELCALRVSGDPRLPVSIHYPGFVGEGELLDGWRLLFLPDAIVWRQLLPVVAQPLLPRDGLNVRALCLYGAPHIVKPEQVRVLR